MQSVITVSSKGQITLPVEARRAMKLADGDKVIFRYEPKYKMVTLMKPMAIEDLSDKLTGYIRPGSKPVLNVDDYYQQHRKART